MFPESSYKVFISLAVWSSFAVASIVCKLFNCAVEIVAPSNLLISAADAVTPSNVFNSVVDAVIPSNVFNSAVETVAPSNIANSVGVTPLTVPVVVTFWEPKSGEIFVPSIAAALLTSAFTILSSLIFALVIAESSIS